MPASAQAVNVITKQFVVSIFARLRARPRTSPRSPLGQIDIADILNHWLHFITTSTIGFVVSISVWIVGYR